MHNLPVLSGNRDVRYFNCILHQRVTSRFDPLESNYRTYSALIYRTQHITETHDSSLHRERLARKVSLRESTRAVFAIKQEGLTIYIWKKENCAGVSAEKNVRGWNEINCNNYRDKKSWVKLYLLSLNFAARQHVYINIYAYVSVTWHI